MTKKEIINLLEEELKESSETMSYYSKQLQEAENDTEKRNTIFNWYYAEHNKVDLLKYLLNRAKGAK